MLARCSQSRLVRFSSVRNVGVRNSIESIYELLDNFSWMDGKHPLPDEAIENLRYPPSNYYTPDRLIRYAHGSTESILKRSSDGEFTMNDTVESSDIVVMSNGTVRSASGNTVASAAERRQLRQARYS